MDRTFADRYGPWALVAGASAGLGASFAQRLAERGLNLLLVARRPDPLEALAAQIRERHHVEVRTLAKDLGRLEDLHAIVQAAGECNVGSLVCNAALSPIGEFLDRDTDEHLALLDLNCRAALILSHRIGSRLVERGRGGIVLMSSLAGLQGTALTAHYSASKAYLRVLGEGLWEELRPRGVDVLAVLAGPTETPTYTASHPRESRWGPFRYPPVQTPDAVVDAALGALGRGPVCVPGAMNTIAEFMMRRLMPAATGVRMVSRTTRKMYGG